ncbi:MAG TPA: YbaK/EbsC family protein [Thermomicrobiales bacterium]|nr:YbaK/EbsC family protein [Thermomicrobiales bacterium]
MEALRQWLVERDGRAEFRRLDAPTATVRDAAVALGVPEDQVMKSLLYLAGERPYLVIANGMHRVDERKLAAALGVPRKRLRMASGDEALAHAGYALGVVPPFGHRAALPTLLDARAAAQPLLWGGTGEDRALLGVTPAEIIRLTGARVADLARGELIVDS